MFLAHSDFQSRDLTYVFIPLTAILFRVTLDSPHSRLPTAHIYGAVLGITLMDKSSLSSLSILAGMLKGAYFVVHLGMSVFAGNGFVLMAWRLVSLGPLITSGELDRQYGVHAWERGSEDLTNSKKN